MVSIAARDSVTKTSHSMYINIQIILQHKKNKKLLMEQSVFLDCATRTVLLDNSQISTATLKLLLTSSINSRASNNRCRPPSLSTTWRQWVATPLVWHRLRHSYNSNSRRRRCRPSRSSRLRLARSNSIIFLLQRISLRCFNNLWVSNFRSHHIYIIKRPRRRYRP